MMAWRLDNARAQLDAMAPGNERDLRDGVLAVYEADYARAKTVLAELLARGSIDVDTKAGKAVHERASHFLSLASGAEVAHVVVHVVHRAPVIETQAR